MFSIKWFFAFIPSLTNVRAAWINSFLQQKSFEKIAEKMENKLINISFV